jgi:hypothetical protein
VIWGAVEDEVADASYFISGLCTRLAHDVGARVGGRPFVELEPLADEKERFLALEEGLTSAGDVLVSGVSGKGLTHKDSGE